MDVHAPAFMTALPLHRPAPPRLRARLSPLPLPLPRPHRPARPTRHARPARAPRMGTAMPEIPEVVVPAPATPDTVIAPELSESTNVTSVDLVPATEDSWLDSALAARASLDQTLHPLAPLRAVAEPLLASMALPSRKIEAWRFTDLRPVYAQRFARPNPASASVSPADVQRVVPDDAAVALVFVDGVFAPHLSRVDGPAVSSLRDAAGHCGPIADYAGEKDRLYAMWGAKELGPGELGGLFPTLGNAVAADALVLHVPKGHVVDGTVVACFLSTTSDAAESATLSASRLAVIADRDASVTLLEVHASLASGAADDAGSHSLTLAGAAVEVAEGASVTHYLINDCARDALLLHNLHASVHANGTYETRPFGLGGRVGRFSVGVDILGQGAHGQVHGALIADGAQVQDIHSRICHDCEGATSSQLQKNVVSDRARAVFAGKIVVTPGSDRTASEQLSRTLLLSDRAQIDAMPVLEIETDDVTCTHGVTVSDLQDDEVFYFQARGISHSVAQAMLVKGFVVEALGESCPFSTMARAIAEKVDKVSEGAMARQKEVTEYSSV